MDTREVYQEAYKETCAIVVGLEKDQDEINKIAHRMREGKSRLLENLIKAGRVEDYVTIDLKKLRNHIQTNRY